MASLTPSLRFLFFLSTLIMNGDFSQTPSLITKCSSFDCGNGITISYPFWHLNQQQHQHEHCGYKDPIFNLSCNHHNPLIINLDSHPYQVKNIDYSNKSLTLAYLDIKNTTCPKLTHGVTISSTTYFKYASGTKIVSFFYNCSLYPPTLPHIECLIYGGKRSFVFLEGSIPEFDWHEHCESTAKVPIIYSNGDLVVGFSRLLENGFKLTWQQEEDGLCESCETSGGLCGYNKAALRKSFFCLCADGRHSLHCHDNGSNTTLWEPNYVAIGTMLFSGLIIAATIIYFIQNKKIVSYKPV